MLLLDLRSYLQERGQASLTDLAHRFRSDPEAMRGMLGHWIGKGKVRRLACAPMACGKSCSGCHASAAPEIYEWLDAPAASGRP
ncbi:FeoC-like transcriptional regulator [Cereibacter sphaeroides]|uniref:FeoC-like transcriptional regulator n=1 Tax=Rhodobacterales TaxID=204455 RepID=UPI000BBEC153|nr:MULTISPECIES: FeoC-like transcriptional regulator [Paracoccaceae]MCE6951845.1 FeoC-like transcriptional regulator [Cereibacter sphaeroides]MCE6961157.1 FeoC-like transcriptional regulator [Cereibacter sphaeroides]MCE6970143.1 FeoC-like transcriptional regulator [Cereibacter sphaeroides]MCE6974118.1 FeoC-like transcriptional regulator [Cereibacter sphaeroides]